jgi:hypothetical protein
MDARVAGGTKSKAESIATALNSLLSQLAPAPAIDVAIVGYRSASHGGEDIGPRWGGTLAGRTFIPTNELANAPLTVETRVRKVPGAGGVGVAREQSVPFPIWYVPSLGGAASRTAGFEHCRGMLSDWLAAAGPECKPPMLVSFVAQVDAHETPDALGSTVRQIQTPAGPPLVAHAHLGSSDRIPATVYPSSDAHLPPGPVRLLFQGSSVLPEEFRESLRRFELAVNAGARGLIYNARMVDLIRLLSLVKTYARYQPPPGSEPATPGAPIGPAAEPATEEQTPPAGEIAATTGDAPGAATGEESITTCATGEVTVTDLFATLGQTPEGAAPESLTVHMPAPDSPTVELTSAEIAAGAAAAEHVAGTEAWAASAPPSQADAQADAQAEAPKPAEKPDGRHAAQRAPTPVFSEAVPMAAGQRVLVMFVLDRSVENPTGEQPKTAWHRLQDQANELLARISQRAAGRIDCALISYGSDAGGHAAVATTFAGPLAGRTVVADTELAGGALRVEEFTEQVSNGIGGLVSVSRKRPVFVDVSSTGAAAPAPAFAAVKGLLTEWRKERGARHVAPVVLHMTRGRFQPDEIEGAVAQLGQVGTFTLYHLVLTESPHPSVAYPSAPVKLRNALLVKLWELTSPLLGAQTFAARKGSVAPGARGIVINGKFDLFLESIEQWRVESKG